MTQEQIKHAIEKWNSLSTEEKEAAKVELLDSLSRIDNLSEISQEVAEKFSGGISWKEFGGILGYIGSVITQRD